MHFDLQDSNNDCKWQVNCDNLKCTHIEEYKNKHGLESYEIVHGFFVSCIGKGSRKIKAQDCVCKAESCKAKFKRVHGCLYCAYFGCFGERHIHQHASEREHFLAIDTNFGHVYCFICQDYRYDFEFEEIANGHRIIAARQRPDLAVYKYVPQARDVKCFKLLPPSRVVLSAEIKPGLRGIINMGNTCYINCILQCLIQAPVFRDYFLSDKHKCSFQEQISTSEEPVSGSSACSICEIGKIVQEFYSGKVCPYIPDKLLYLMWTTKETLAGYYQQDAHEFLLEFFDILHRHCKGTNNQMEHYSNCMIEKIFTGLSQSQLTCLKCNSVLSTNVATFKDISLDLGSHTVGEENASPLPTLIDCLERLTQIEDPDEKNTIQRICDKCQSMQKCSMQMKLKKLPLIITFHLKRLISETLYSNQPIEFPEHMDMTPYMSYYKVPTDSSSQEGLIRNGCNKPISNKFYLYAVVQHKGNSELGHYKSYVRANKNQWYLCDDEKITQIKFDEVKEIPAYLLFYHKAFLEYDAKSVKEDKLILDKMS